MSVTICLARTGTSSTDLIKPDYSGIVPYQIQIDPDTPALLYIAPSVSHPPDWASFFEGFIDPGQFGQNSSTGALLIVERRQRRFALPFGRAHFMLNEDHLEDKFGLKVALNCIGDGKVRSLQKRSLDQILRLETEGQTGRLRVFSFGHGADNRAQRIDFRMGIRLSGGRTNRRGGGRMRPPLRVSGSRPAMDSISGGTSSFINSVFLGNVGDSHFGNAELKCL